MFATKIGCRGARAMRLGAFALALALAALAAGCGGGGGGGSTGGSAVTVTGTVIRAETGTFPNPPATITISGRSTSTLTDGTFTLSGVPLSATTATVAAQGEQTRTLTLHLAGPAGATDSLGNIYISNTGYNANANGRVVTTVNGQPQPVGGASVTIAGTTTLSATDGTFSITGLPVGLGTDPTTPIGVIHAAGFVDKQIFVQFPLAAGANDLGDQQLGAPVSGNAPGLPYTVTGVVDSGGQPASGINVTIETGGQVLGNPVQTDSTGHYYFWVVPGTYTVIALQNGQEFTTTVQLFQPDNPVTAPTINI